MISLIVLSNTEPRAVHFIHSAAILSLAEVAALTAARYGTSIAESLTEEARKQNKRENKRWCIDAVKEQIA